MSRLTEQASEMLRRIYTAHAALPFPAERMERLRPPELCRAELESVLLELRQSGFIELRQKLWGERLYRIPVQRIPDLLEGLFPLRLPQTGTEAAVSRHSGGPPLTGELFRALLFIAEEGLPITAKGGIHKASFNRLASRLTMRGEKLHGLLPETVVPLLGPLQAALALDLLMALGLAAKGGAGYMLEPEVLGGWLLLREAEMMDIVYSVVQDRYGKQEAPLQHFRHWITTAAFPAGQWFTLRDTLGQLEEAGLPEGQAADSLKEAGEAWLLALAEWGWMELGSATSGELCFRWTEMKPARRFAGTWQAGGWDMAGGESDATAEEAACLIVQPDFEVLVTPDVPYSCRWMLSACAELLHSEDIWSFKLSKERLIQAAENGLQPEEAIRWLTEHAQGGLPEQVATVLRQWARSIGRTSLSEMILLTCRSLADAETIAAHPRLRLERLGPQHFAVAADDLEPLRKELAAAGMAPPRRIGGRDEGHPPLRTWGPGLKKSAQAKPYALPLQNAAGGLLGGFPAGAEELPLIPVEASEMPAAWGDWPQMWLRDWRRYHASTARQMMEQALAAGLKVQIALQDEICLFIPERTHGIPWRVEGTLLHPGRAAETAVLREGDWQEMQLLPPRTPANSSSAITGGYVIVKKSTVTR